MRGIPPYIPVVPRPSDVAPRLAVCLAVCLGGAGLRARPAGGQELGWSGTAEGSANLLFGAARSRLVAAGTSVGRADSALQVRGDLRLTYADTREEAGERHTTARATRASVAVDARPFARVSPFGFGSAESSLQQRIASRVAGGAGAKLTLHRRGDDDVSVSLALLAERTRALRPEPGAAPLTTRARWSLRARYRRRLSEALRVTHVTFYQPAFDRPGRFTADSDTSLLVALNSALSLTATVRDRYDSEARRRGAPSNHDGQVLFGARAGF